MTATDTRYGNWLPSESAAAEKCEAHETWWALNKETGCVHPDHGDYPLVAPGLVRVVCGCAVAFVDVGRTCHSCGQTMRQVDAG